MLKNIMQFETKGDTEIVITRLFNAPRQMVWDAHTKPELLKRWLSGPPGWTMTTCEMDLTVGGKYRWVWSNDDGTVMGMGGVHREVAPPEKIVNTQLFDQDWTGGAAIGTLLLTEVGTQTKLLNTVKYISKEARDGCLQSGMDKGMAMGYDRLEDVLAAIG